MKTISLLLSILLASIMMLASSCGEDAESETHSATPESPFPTSSATPSEGSATPSVTPTLVPTPTRDMAGADVLVTDDMDGDVISLHVGQSLRLELRSTYWMIEPVANAASLRQESAPTSEPDPDCVPGGGCGKLTATYVAVTAGETSLQASRRLCGEALLCSEEDSHFAVTVRVEG